MRGNLAAIVSAQGEYGAARELLHQAIEVKRRLQDIESLCVDLLILGMVEGSTGGFDAAIAALEEAREIGASLEGRSQEIDAHSRLALVHLNRGDVRAAKSSAKAAVKRAGVGRLAAGPRHGAPGGRVRRDGRRQPRDAFAWYTEARRHYTIAGSDVLAREARAGTAAAQSALGPPSRRGRRDRGAAADPADRRRRRQPAAERHARARVAGAARRR